MFSKRSISSFVLYGLALVVVVVLLVGVLSVLLFKRSRLSFFLVESVPLIGSWIRVGNLEVNSHDSDYSIIVNNRPGFLAIVDAVSLFGKDGIKFPHHNVMVIDRVVVSIEDLESFSSKKGLDLRNIDFTKPTLHYDGTEKPIKLWFASIDDSQNAIKFDLLLDKEVIKNNGWSDRDLSVFANTEVLMFLKRDIELDGVGNYEAIWQDYYDLTSAYATENRLPFVLKAN